MNLRKLFLREEAAPADIAALDTILDIPQAAPAEPAGLPGARLEDAPRVSQEIYDLMRREPAAGMNGKKAPAAPPIGERVADISRARQRAKLRRRAGRLPPRDEIQSSIGELSGEIDIKRREQAVENGRRQAEIDRLALDLSGHRARLFEANTKAVELWVKARLKKMRVILERLSESDAELRAFPVIDPGERGYARFFKKFHEAEAMNRDIRRALLTVPEGGRRMWHPHRLAALAAADLGLEITLLGPFHDSGRTYRQGHVERAAEGAWRDICRRLPYYNGDADPGPSGAIGFDLSRWIRPTYEEQVALNRQRREIREAYAAQSAPGGERERVISTGPFNPNADGGGAQGQAPGARPAARLLIRGD